jgi:hypothetical protein
MTIDDDKGPSQSGKEQGLLDTLADRQEEVKNVLNDILNPGEDLTYSAAAFQASLAGYEDIDNLVAVTLVLVQLSSDPHREITKNDVVWSMEFLDHLDTLGLQIAPKGVIVRG